MNSRRRTAMLKMNDEDWKFLLRRIKAGKCTPFLGAGASFGTFPLGSEIARAWAEEYKYPMADSYDLARVAQYMAVTTEDHMAPKDKIQEQFQALPLPDFASPDEPHRVLADLPFPIYITTNYDNSMITALQQRFKNPKLTVCSWNKQVREYIPSIFVTDPDYQPSAASPLVFHLHGHLDMAESLVLTEDDYLDFLIYISEDQDLIPLPIRRAMTSSSLLFLGYKIADWDFRVLFRRIVGYLSKSTSRSHISIQLAPEYEGISREQQENIQKYLESYYGEDKVRVYWGSCQEFAAELRRRWVEYNHGN
jgi:SIR2-like domain